MFSIAIVRVDVILLGRVKVIRIELRTRKETLISFTYHPSTYSECVIVRAVCGAYDQPTYVMCH